MSRQDKNLYWWISISTVVKLVICGVLYLFSRQHI